MKLRHICEICGTEEILDSEEAFNAGWDYPPGIGMFGVVSPRTCSNPGTCPIDQTVWWQLAIKKVPMDQLTEEQLAVVNRIVREPESILP